MTNQPTPTIATESLFGAPCPISVGDQVVLRDHPATRGRVVYLCCHDGIAHCVIETPSGARWFVHPWALMPVGTHVLVEVWQRQMDTLVAAQRARVVHLLLDRHTSIVHRIAHVVGRLGAIASGLRCGDVPAEDADPTELPAHDLDDELRELTEFRELIAASGLLTTAEIQLWTTIAGGPDSGRETGA